MTENTWQKSDVPQHEILQSRKRGERAKFAVGGILLLGAVIYMVFWATSSSTTFFITVDELVNDSEQIGKTVRISGAVIGDTIIYDDQNLTLEFTVANVETDTGDLATSLYQAVNNPNATRLNVYIENEVMPDLLQHEAQAIMTGSLGEDGTFYATELLLKCPSRYGDSMPVQSQDGEV